MFEKIKCVNLFNSDSNDEVVIDRERKTTRLYIFLLLFLLCILAVYVIWTETVQIQHIEKPSQAEYLRLEARYPGLVECPCTNSKIYYAKLIELRVQYHQICSSDFIAPSFIAQLLTFDPTQNHPYDFMTNSGIYFTHLALLCQLVQTYVNTAFADYMDTLFLTSTLLTPDTFDLEMKRQAKSKSDFVKRYVAHAFLDALQLSSKFFGISTVYTPFNLRVTDEGSIAVAPSDFFNCSCVTHPETCSTHAAFYSYTPSTDSLVSLFKVTGLRLACSPTQSTLQSTFACWYSAPCYEQVIHLLVVLRPMLIRIVPIVGC